MDNKKMVALNEDQLEKVDGGFFGTALAIGAIIAFLGSGISLGVAAGKGDFNK